MRLDTAAADAKLRSGFLLLPVSPTAQVQIKPMTLPVSTIYAVAYAIVTACWIGFILAFLLRPRPAANVDRKKDTSSISGVVIQAISFFIVFTFRRDRFTSPVHVGQYIDLSIALAA